MSFIDMSFKLNLLGSTHITHISKHMRSTLQSFSCFNENIYLKFFIVLVSISPDAHIAATATRNCVGIWDLRMGKLVMKLADSPLGAIVTHAEITKDGK